MRSVVLLGELDPRHQEHVYPVLVAEHRLGLETELGLEHAPRSWISGALNLGGGGKHPPVTLRIALGHQGLPTPHLQHVPQSVRMQCLACHVERGVEVLHLLTQQSGTNLAWRAKSPCGLCVPGPVRYWLQPAVIPTRCRRGRVGSGC